MTSISATVHIACCPDDKTKMRKVSAGLFAVLAAATLAEPPADRRYLPTRKGPVEPRALTDRYGDLVGAVGTSYEDFLPQLADTRRVAPSAPGGRTVGLPRQASSATAYRPEGAYDTANTLSTLFGLPAEVGVDVARAKTPSPGGPSRLLADDTYSAPYGVPSGAARSKFLGAKSPSRPLGPAPRVKGAPPGAARYTLANTASSNSDLNAPRPQLPRSGGVKYRPSKAPPPRYSGPPTRVTTAPSSSGAGPRPVLSDTYIAASKAGEPAPAARYGGPSGSGSKGSSQTAGGSPPPRVADVGGQTSPAAQYGGPASAGASRNNGLYASSQAYQDTMSEPANYDFSYEVKDEATLSDFGHRESRRDQDTKGSYHVLLPDGRNQVVDYAASPAGYVPTVRYEATGRTSPGYAAVSDPSRGGPY